MKDVKERAESYIAYAKQYLELKDADANYVRNRVLEILSAADEDELTAEQSDAIYGELSLLPSEINGKFQALCKEDAKRATDWLYNYCVHNDYVKKAALDKNPRFESEGLVITINKAKPEFSDPKKAKAGNSVDGGFAKCVICRENEGLGARNKRTLRTVDITLGGQPWFWQYSPYGYFNEHGIAVNCEHIPMHVDGGTFARLMDFVDMFPHYFIGCNAALERIGGSVLAHDHYQGGGEILPMHRAKAAYTLTNKLYPGAIAEVVDWKGTVIRVVSKSRADIQSVCSAICDKWRNYSAPELGIIAEDDSGVHNSVSPTVLKTDRGYEMSVILRSNITSEKYPDGVFHAHPEYHAIKKESIGLIEAQGLFILPGRLDGQLAEVEKAITENRPLPKELGEFDTLYSEVKAMGGNAHKAMQKQLGIICGKILENTAVFKDRKLTLEFMKDLGFEN